MALDTRYRPRRFEDVIGQEGTVKVLREFVRKGAGFHQSYVFCGSHGSGKTTVARILARALLCENPQGGDPCDQCISCLSILERGTAEGFVEVDAATNSGKDDIRAIVDTLRYDTFSGRRRVFIFDESHRLSRDALDALLKPMEDTVPGSDDKLLICLFCTTEPEKMRATIFSRCAPAFVVRKVTPEAIADRLTTVCKAEQLEFQREALVLIAEATECHIRDALKAAEGVSMLGAINVEHVRSYLRLNATPLYQKILVCLGRDIGKALAFAEEALTIVSPTTAYEQLAEISMLAYRLHLGAAKVPSYLSEKVLRGIGEAHQDFLLRFAEELGSRPGHPTGSMLACDLAKLHHIRLGTWKTQTATVQQVIQVEQTVAHVPVVPIPVQTPVSTTTESVGMVVSSPTPVAEVPPTNGNPIATIGPPVVTEVGVYVDPRGINTRGKGHHTKNTAEGVPPLEPVEFRRFLHRLVSEMILNGKRAGSTG